MKAVDLGATIRVVIQNFSYGSDQEFYERAATGNLLIAIEDGTDDGDEHIESYLIPTWAANETVLQVLTRYFPYETDSNGEISAIWTPEYRTDNPAWCKNWRRPTDYPNKAIWCKHTLSIDHVPFRRIFNCQSGSMLAAGKDAQGGSCQIL